MAGFAGIGWQWRRADQKARDAFKAQQTAVKQHELAQSQRELRRMETFAAMDDTAKLALAAVPNAEALNDFMKTRVHATMDAGQLAALAGVAGAGRLTPAEALEQVKQEQARREVEVDKDRRHQVELLATQARFGAGIVQAVRQCAHGHPAREGDRFCASCGAPVTPRPAATSRASPE